MSQTQQTPDLQSQQPQQQPPRPSEPQQQPPQQQPPPQQQQQPQPPPPQQPQPPPPQQQPQQIHQLQHRIQQPNQIQHQPQQRHPIPTQLSPTIVSAPMQLSNPTATATSRPGTAPGTIISSPSGVPGQMRPAEYLVLLAPNPRQPGVQGLRYPFIPIQRHQMMTSSGATILQRPTLIRGVSQTGMGVHPGGIPTSQPFGFAGVQTTMGTPSSIIHHGAVVNATSATPSQMTQNQALEKGTNFFNSLLTRMPEKKITIQNLIQSLIDGKKTSAEFASVLQRELNSGPQLQLVPFLDLLLPTLRQSLNTGQTKIPGIRPPAMQASTQFALPLASSPTIMPPAGSPSREPQATNSGITTSPSAPQPPKKKKIPLPPGQKSAYALKKEAREARKREKELAAMNIKQEKPDEKKESSIDEKQPQQKTEKPLPKPKSDKPKQPKQKKQEKQLESLSATLRDDDDVNDVAAMGGVNLAEESQRIMASGAELVGTQIRSCKDEPFFDTKTLSTKISRIVNEYNLSEPSNDVITIISHATQERLKDIVERLGVVAEQRSENLKFNPKYEASNDIKGQMKFLADLDRIEKRRYEEQERELLLRVAKSRSKVEDPEQQKLRQKAKDMQRAEQEEVRQREANRTALLAIGPRKKMKTSTSSASIFSQSMSFTSETKANVDIKTDLVRRTKRVNMRDLQVLLELDRMHLNHLIKIAAQ